MPAVLWLAGILFCIWLYGIVDAFLADGSDGKTQKGE
jgi:hypothetical protein